jgi:hypothetical protein
MAMQIIDDRMFVSPYLAAACYLEPCLEYSQTNVLGTNASDWEACSEHYGVTYEYSSPVISEKLLQRIAADVPGVQGLLEDWIGDDPVERDELSFREPGPYETAVDRLYAHFSLPTS